MILESLTASSHLCVTCWMIRGTALIWACYNGHVSVLVGSTTESCGHQSVWMYVTRKYAHRFVGMVCQHMLLHVLATIRCKHTCWEFLFSHSRVAVLKSANTCSPVKGIQIDTQSLQQKLHRGNMTITSRMLGYCPPNTDPPQLRISGHYPICAGHATHTSRTYAVAKLASQFNLSTRFKFRPKKPACEKSRCVPLQETAAVSLQHSADLWTRLKN